MKTFTDIFNSTNHSNIKRPCSWQGQLRHIL